MEQCEAVRAVYIDVLLVGTIDQTEIQLRKLRRKETALMGLRFYTNAEAHALCEADRLRIRKTSIDKAKIHSLLLLGGFAENSDHKIHGLAPDKAIIDSQSIRDLEFGHCGGSYRKKDGQCGRHEVKERVTGRLVLVAKIGRSPWAIESCAPSHHLPSKI